MPEEAIMVSARAEEQLPPVMIEEHSSPDERARRDELWMRFERNLSWFQRHAVELSEQYKGKYICVAGESVFPADEPRDAVAAAKAAHPEDWGAFYTTFVTPNSGPKINAI
jgi:hypothetical protein